MAQPKGVVFDLSQTEFLGTVFLETILRVSKRAAERGIQTVLVGLHGPVKELFEMTRLVTILPQAESVEAVISAGQDSS